MKVHILRLGCVGLILGLLALAVCGCNLIGDDPAGGGTTGGGGDDGGGTGSDFAAISGSGTITINVSGAETAGYLDAAVFYGAGGIAFGDTERTGGSDTVSGDAMSVTLQDDGGSDFVFTGGQPVNVGFIIDVDGSDSADDGDLVAMRNGVVVNGNTTVSFTVPDDFTTVSGSGTLTIEVNGAYAAHADKKLFYGASGIPTNQHERVGGEATVSANPVSILIPEPAAMEPIESIAMMMAAAPSGYVFTGGFEVGGVGAIIDADNSGVIDDGDWVAFEENVLIDAVEGSQTVSFTYPTDFEQISGSGVVSINVLGANTAHSGKDLMYGASGITFGQSDRTGDFTTIASDDILVTVPDYEHSGDMLFAGGMHVAFIGCVIDVDGDERAGDGDYLAKRTNLTVNGDTVVTFTY